MSHLIAENEIGTEIKKSETFRCLSKKYGGRNEQMYRYKIAPQEAWINKHDCAIYPGDAKLLLSSI